MQRTVSEYYAPAAQDDNSATSFGGLASCNCCTCARPVLALRTPAAMFVARTVALARDGVYRACWDLGSPAVPLATCKLFTVQCARGRNLPVAFGRRSCRPSSESRRISRTFRNLQ